MKKILKKLGLLSLVILGMIATGAIVTWATQNVLLGLLSMFVYIYVAAKWDKL